MVSFLTRRFKGAVFLSLMLAAATAMLQAQTPTGEIRLAVKDPSGAAVQASGTLHNPAGGADRTFQTDAQGTYTLSGLPYGHYRLEIAKTGFATFAASINVQSPT